MHGSRSVLAAMLLAAVSACSPSLEETSVLLVVTADPAVRARCAEVRLHVRAGRLGRESDVTEIHDVDASGWPLRAVIVPRDGDATRPLQIEVDALDPAGTPIARLATSPSFAVGQQRLVTVHFEASCLGVHCPPGETCVAGVCASMTIHPVEPDAGIAPIDPGCEMRSTWLDEDGDGYGDPATMTMSCEPRPGSMDRGGDCDDRCPECHPGASELCGSARDEDCDGDVDEGCAGCIPGELRPCPGGTDVGPCHAGTQACVGGYWSECIGRFDPQDETCNAIDDDCDGLIDDGVMRACSDGCTSSCHLGLWNECSDRYGYVCED